MAGKDIPIDDSKLHAIKGSTLKQLMESTRIDGVRGEIVVRTTKDNMTIIGFASVGEFQYGCENGVPVRYLIPAQRITDDETEDE